MGKEKSPGLMDALTAFQMTKDGQGHEDDAINVESATEADRKSKQPSELVSQLPQGYTKIKKGNASKYIGYRVRVQRKTAPVMEGKLVSANKSKLKIQQRRYGGIIDFPV